MGLEIKEIIARGSFVSDEIVNPLLVNAINDNKNKPGIIFDGYPRSIIQAENLEQILNKENQIIEIPLNSWQDIANSKITIFDFIKTPYNFLKIIIRYKFNKKYL